MVTSLRSKWAARQGGPSRTGSRGRISESIRNRRATRPPAHFQCNPPGRDPVGCFSALLARPVWIQIWALYRQSGSDRLEKQPTDLRRHHHYMRDGALVPSHDHSFGFLDMRVPIAKAVMLSSLICSLFNSPAMRPALRTIQRSLTLTNSGTSDELTITAYRSRANLRITEWISSLVLISTPRVGSFNRRIRD